MKKIIALLLALVMVFALVACGNSGGNETPAGGNNTPAGGNNTPAGGNEASGAGQYKVGINYLTGGSYALISLARTSEQANVAAGGETMAIDDGGSIEQIVADFENMIQSGCDGLIIWCPVETIVTTIAEMCREAEVPFVLSDKIPSDPAVIENLYSNPYFVGGVAPANGDYGAYAAQVCLDKGYKKAIVSAPGVGDATGEPRTAGFVETFEAGGGTVYTVLNYDMSIGDNGLSAVENALVAYPDVEVIFGTGSDFGVAAMNAVANNGGDYKVITCDFDETLMGQVGQGPLLALVGDYWVAGFFSGVLLQNFMDGHPLLDAEGKAPWIDDLLYFSVGAEQVDLYKKFWIDEYCYSTEEIQNMFVANNPDFDLEALKEIMYAYSFEDRLIAKYNEGKVSADELAAVGVNVK